MSQLKGFYLAIEPGTAQLKGSYHHPRYFVVAPPPRHRLLPSCYAVSWISSWPSPVRGARHGKDAQYFALYNAHMGVPVRQKEVSHRTLCVTRGCIYWKDVVPSRMSYAGQYQGQISFCQTTIAYVHPAMPPLYFDPMQDLQIVDSTHKLQEHDPRSADVSDVRLGAVAECGFAGRTVIYFPPLFAIFTRPRSRRRGIRRLRILPITCAILIHYIGAYVSKYSIG